MANGSGEKSEEPTPKKIEDARKKGQVAQNQDLTSAILFLAAAAVLGLTGAASFGSLFAFMHDTLSMVGRADVGQTWEGLASASLNTIVLASAPLLIVLFVLAAIVKFLLVGPLFTMQPLSPKLEKVNPAAGFKRMFSMKNLFELAKGIAKIGIAGAIAWAVVRSSFRDLALTAGEPLDRTALLAASLVGRLVVAVGGAYLGIGVLDLVYQKKQYTKQLRMTKDEVKREMKQEEGDPVYKGHRRELHQEILAHSVVENVRHADVVIPNPTHLAVALRYDRSTMNAPQVVAKGAELMAQKILEIAEQFHIPIMRDVTLAHALYGLELGDEIPEELFEAVAEVLRFVWSQREQME